MFFKEFCKFFENSSFKRTAPETVSDDNKRIFLALYILVTIQASYQEFFEAVEVSWDIGSLIKVSCTTNIGRTVHGKILVFFLKIPLKLYFK